MPGPNGFNDKSKHLRKKLYQSYTLCFRCTEEGTPPSFLYDAHMSLKPKPSKKTTEHCPLEAQTQKLTTKNAQQPQQHMKTVCRGQRCVQSNTPRLSETQAHLTSASTPPKQM